MRHVLGKKGPVEGVAADPRYLDVWVPPGQRKRLPVESSRHAFAYVFEGAGTFSDASEPLAVQTEYVGERSARPADVANRSLVLFDSGDEVTVQAGPEGFGSCSSPARRSASRSRGAGRS